MILVEPSSENFLLYSDDFSQSSWIKNGTASVASNTTISPDGTLNASTISNATGTSTSDTVFLSINPADVDHTFSVYVKSAGATTMSLFMRSGVTGVILSQAISLTDEWQRVTLTHNIQNGQLIFGNSDGDFHVWGAQFETGSVATSYIPTSGGNAAARTRAADELVISGSAFSSFFNGSEGTFYIEVIDRTPTENSVYVSGQSIQQAFLYSNVDLAVDSYDGANFQRISGVVANELFRAAATYDSTSKKISLNGTTYADGAHTGNWGTATILNIGWGGSGNAGYPQINGHLKRLIYWPTESGRL
jgi:hypothetical protein